MLLCGNSNCTTTHFCLRLLLLRDRLILRGLLWRRLSECWNQKRRERKSRNAADMRLISFLLVKKFFPRAGVSRGVGVVDTTRRIRPDSTPTPPPAEWCRKRRHMPKYRRRESHLRLLKCWRFESLAFGMAIALSVRHGTEKLESHADTLC